MAATNLTTVVAVAANAIVVNVVFGAFATAVVVDDVAVAVKALVTYAFVVDTAVVAVVEVIMFAAFVVTVVAVLAIAVVFVACAQYLATVFVTSAVAITNVVIAALAELAFIQKLAIVEPIVAVAYYLLHGTAIFRYFQFDSTNVYLKPGCARKTLRYGIFDQLVKN